MKWKWKLNIREADDTCTNQLASQLQTTANGTALDDSKMKRKEAAGESFKSEAKSGSRKKRHRIYKR